MSVSQEQLVAVLKSTGYLVYQNEAKKNQDYPYLVYSFVSEDDKKASGKIFKTLPYYQISLHTEGDRDDLKKIRKAFNDQLVPFKPFQSLSYKENNKHVTNFYTYVRCLENGPE